MDEDPFDMDLDEDEEIELRIHFKDLMKVIIAKKSETIKDITLKAYQLLLETTTNKTNVISLDQVRLRTWNSWVDIPGRVAFTNRMDNSLSSLSFSSPKSLLLEIRDINSDFPEYKEDDVFLKLVKWKHSTQEFDKQTTVITVKRSTLVKDFSSIVLKEIGLEVQAQRLLVTLDKPPLVKIITKEEENLSICDTFGLIDGSKVYIEPCTDSQRESPAFNKLLQQQKNAPPAAQSYRPKERGIKIKKKLHA